MAKLEEALKAVNPQVKFVRPQLPHSDKKSPISKSVNFLKNLKIAGGTLIVGKSAGGLAAAKLQEESRPDLYVICISSPTRSQSGDVKLVEKMPRRVAVYSSTDGVIAGRVERWPLLANAYDLPWLTHDTDAHIDKLAKLIQGYINGEDLSLLV